MIKEKVILFGASKYGEKVFEKIKNKYEVIYFCDNDNKKIGTVFCDRPVISPEELIKIITKENIKLIITSSFYVEIVIQLSHMQLDYCYIAFLKNDYDPINREWTTDIYIKEFDIRQFRTIEVGENSIGVIVRNNSGSNTLALWRMIPQHILQKYDVKMIYEGNNRVDYYKKIFGCKVLVTTHSNNLYYLPPDSRKYFQLWHGFILKGLGLMDKSVPLNEKRNVKDWKRYDVITSYSPLYSTLLNACFGGNTYLYKITGAPRNDFLFNSNGKDLLSNLLNINLKDKKVIFYMPTFRANSYNQYISGNKCWHNIFGFKDDFDYKEFNSFLTKNNIVMILKMHPYEELFVKDLIKKQKINNAYLILDSDLVRSGIDLYEFLNACDLLITDYSSVYFDYLLLDRPIIFTPIDLDDYIENAGMLYGPFDFWTPGPKVLDQETLQNQILNNLYGKDEYSNQRSMIKDIVHYYKDANSHKRVWNLIEEVLNS